MATNQYFNKFNRSSEQNLLESLVIESIKIHGIDCIYVKRVEDINSSERDLLFGEDKVGHFSATYPIEMYVEEASSFGGQGEIISKFGLQINDTSILTVSRKRFFEETGMKLPREGDLLFFPLSNSLFEIKYVDTENPFYQFGKLYTCKLHIELFQNTGEEFNTGITAIDSIQSDRTYTILFNLNPSGTGTFKKNQEVTSGASFGGYVYSFSPANLTLELYSIYGDIPESGFITNSLGASWGIATFDDFEFTTDTYADNEILEDTGDTILDWSVEHPFNDGENL